MEHISPIHLAQNFERIKAPETGRNVVQLTTGKAFCYPLYYFIRSITKDGKYLIYHRSEADQVQMWRLDLSSGKSVVLTNANAPATMAQWKPWDVYAGSGVLDHRSVLNAERNLLVYFDANNVHSVDVITLEDKLLFQIPDDREAIGQNCASPDGNWLIYIHAPKGSQQSNPCKGAVVAAYNFGTKEHRALCTIDSPIHHVLPYDSQHFIFCHPFGHMGMMMTDLVSGKWSELRKGDPGAVRDLCHFVATNRGLAYEVPGKPQIAGLYNPFNRKRFEFLMPSEFGYTHTGRDPEGRLWFYENQAEATHDLWFLRQIDQKKGGDWLHLTGNWPTFGGGQKAHFHPQLTPDRKWILMVAGDPQTETNHIFLVDVSDLEDTLGISDDLLSHNGANDIDIQTSIVL